MMNIMDMIDEFSKVLNVETYTHDVYNGRHYFTFKWNENEVTIHNDNQLDDYRIHVIFAVTRNSFYVDHLMRRDSSLNVELPYIIIPIRMQMDYFKDKYDQIMNEEWCKEMTNDPNFNQSEFIRNFNKKSNTLLQNKNKYTLE